MTSEGIIVTKHEENDGITCKEFISALVDYLARELPAKDDEQMELHLEVCPDCVKYLRSYDVTIKLGKKALAENDDESGELSDEFVKVVLSATKKKPA
jgi:anti-sigma factor RsiW